MNIAFDIDDTLYKVMGEGINLYQAPDYNLIQVLLWFYNNGDNVFVWSAGGIDYARQIVHKLGLDNMVQVIEKQEEPNMDITFDDQEVNLGLINIRVNRETHIEYE